MAVGPLQHAAKTEGDSIDFEEDFDREAGARCDWIFGAKAATFLAQIDKTSLKRRTMANKKNNGIFIDRVARIGTAFLRGRKLVPVFPRAHGLLRSNRSAEVDARKLMPVGQLR